MFLDKDVPFFRTNVAIASQISLLESLHSHKVYRLLACTHLLDVTVTLQVHQAHDSAEA